MPIGLDLNNAEFQAQWFALEKEDQLSVLAACAKLVSRGTWIDVYNDKGLRWEAIHTRNASDGARMYSIRITKRFRAVVVRRGEVLSFVSLHPNHDSAYM